MRLNAASRPALRPPLNPFSFIAFMPDGFGLRFGPNMWAKRDAVVSLGSAIVPPFLRVLPYGLGGGNRVPLFPGVLPTMGPIPTCGGIGPIVFYRLPRARSVTPAWISMVRAAP